MSPEKLKKLSAILANPDSGQPFESVENIIGFNPANKRESNYLDLRPSEAVSNEQIPDYIAHYEIDSQQSDYFNEEFGADTLEDFRRLRQYVFSLIPENSEFILDVGSGGAWLAKMAAKSMPQSKIISFDLSSVNVKKAVEIYPSENHFGIAGDALQPPFREGSIDCIVSSEVIEHVPEPGLFAQKLLKLLKPGGKLIISTPYKEKLRYEICVKCNSPTPRNAHLHTFDENFLEKCGGSEFSDYEYFTFGNKALLILQYHKISKYFGFSLWKLTDSLANKIIDKRAHIIGVFTR